MEAEKIFEVFWDGPFEWRKGIKDCKEHHILYQVYGYHPLYGSNVLLYIGSSHTSVKTRLKEHEWWLDEEWEDTQVRLGSIREFTTWRSQEVKKRWPKPGKMTVEAIEALLIYANQPVYNDRNKSDAKKAKGIRIFNNGRLGQILPEVSHKYFLGG